MFIHFLTTVLAMTSVSQWTVTWVLLFLSVSRKAVSDAFTVSGLDSPLSVWMGSSVILPCSVSPAFTDSLEVRWHRPENFKTPVLLYEKQQTHNQSADPQYRGRVSLTGELDKGDVSLTLENVTLADSGEYVCFVAGKTLYGQASIRLIVKAMGTPPVLSVTDGGSGQVNVSCVSDGWFPKPTLTWTQQGGTKMSQSFDTAVDAQGHASVTSQLLLPLSKSKWLSCSVGLSEYERRESRILPYISENDTGIWKGLFIAALVLLLPCLVGLIFLSMKVLELKKKPEDRKTEVEMPLQPNIGGPAQDSEGHVMRSQSSDQLHVGLRLDPPDDTQQYATGKEALLSFNLSPKTSAVPMEIRWFKGQDCIYLYKNGQGKGSYKGRASLCMEELENGTISLRLENIQKEDAGNYVCQIIVSTCLENGLRINHSEYSNACAIYPTECSIDEDSRKKMEASAKSLGSTCDTADSGEDRPLIDTKLSVL